MNVNNPPPRNAVTPGPSGLSFTVLLTGLLVLGGLIAFGMFVRRIGDLGVETDFYGTYAPRAEALRHGSFNPAHYGVVGPLYELVLSAGIALGLHAFDFAKILSAAATAGTLLLWGDIAACLFGAAAGTLLPWFLLLSPAFVRFGYTASSDALYVFLVSLVYALLLRRERKLGTALAGMAGLAACLTRYQALLLPLTSLIWLTGRTRASGRWIRFLLVCPGLLVLIGGLLAAGGVDLPRPGFLYNIHYESRREQLDWDRYNDAATGVRDDPFRTVLKLLPRLPGLVIANIPGHLAVEARDAAGLPLTLLATLGLLGVVVSAGARPHLLKLAALWAVQFTALLPVIASERYALMQVPILAAFAAGGLAAAGAHLPKLRRVGLVLVIGALIAGLALNGRRLMAEQSGQPRYLLDIAGRLSETVRPGDGIMARKPHLPYLLKARWVAFPDAVDLATLRDRMRETRPAYVLYGTSEYAMRPAFHFLTFPPYRPPGWQKIDWIVGTSAFYSVSPEFYTADLPADDATVRALQNATLDSEAVPIAASRRLARYLAETGRCRAALSEYERLRKFTTLDEDEVRLEAGCRANAGH